MVRKKGDKSYTKSEKHILVSLINGYSLFGAPYFIFLVRKEQNEGGFQIKIAAKLSTIVSKIRVLTNEENIY